MNAIETHALSRRFGNLDAVNGLNLTVPAGAVFALLGPNGSGKTTTIKMLMNQLAPTSGEAKVLGKDSRQLGPSELARIGYVAEGMELPEWMTVRYFLDYCRPFYPTWDSALEKTLLSNFGLPTDRQLRHLSRGMRMKAALTAALAFRPTLLVLDEPFSGLDPVVRDDFIRGLIETSSLGEWTIFVSSHDIEEVERLADWIGVIEEGRLRFAEPLETLQRRFRRIEVTRFGTISATATSRPAHWLAYEEAGMMSRFIESAYAPDLSEQLCRDIFPGATFSAKPMPLRDIYITLARSKSTPNPRQP